MIPYLFWALSGLAVVPGTTVEQVDFTTGERRTVALAHENVAETDSDPGTLGGEAMGLPRSAPSLPLRGSGFSALHRARDLFDVSNYPARAVAKLYRLNEDGTRSPTACTAQFIGPKHLLTAGHCIMHPASRIVHPGFEIDVRFDAGIAQGGTARILRAWVATEQLLLRTPADALVTADRCSDYAVLEIAEPIGAEVGWLAMRDRPPTAGARGDGLMYRFSYPHQRSGDLIAARDQDRSLSAEERTALQEAVAEARLRDLNFSPDDLYFDYGIPDDAQGRYIAKRIFAANGQSGSALLDERGAITAIHSRTYNEVTFSCRITAADIGAIVAIKGLQPADL